MSNTETLAMPSNAKTQLNRCAWSFFAGVVARMAVTHADIKPAPANAATNAPVTTAVPAGK